MDLILKLLTTGRWKNNRPYSNYLKNYFNQQKTRFCKAQIKGWKMELHVIYTDFTRSFDTVDQNIIINKLFKHRVPHRASYLVGSFFKVKINGSKIRGKVPHGFHLGPLLFYIHIYNEIGLCVNSLFQIFVDVFKVNYTIM